MQDTIAMVNLLAPTGTLYENEKRVSFGLAFKGIRRKKATVTELGRCRVC